VKSLIIGSGGQIGTELTKSLREKYGWENVITSDIVEKPGVNFFYRLDATDKHAIAEVLSAEKIDEVYLMAAILSAKAEQFPMHAWQVNMNVLFNLLELFREGKLKKLFWPSSIAVFGPHTPKTRTPQFTVTDPDTVYGISKLAGERWAEYYFEKYGLDIRSIRYPGVISWKVQPGGGTTDYAVEMFHYALRGEKYICYIDSDEMLPMIYIDDAIRATVELMQAPPENIRIRSSYNLAGISFTPSQLYEAIRKYIPGFQVEFKPDFRQEIARTWPGSIDDSAARKDWNWQHRFELDDIVKDMLANLQKHFYQDAEVYF
jgi:nucleoside-diphosphate-sugar epimerase